MLRIGIDCCKTVHHQAEEGSLNALQLTTNVHTGCRGADGSEPLAGYTAMTLLVPSAVLRCSPAYTLV